MVSDVYLIIEFTKTEHLDLKCLYIKQNIAVCYDTHSLIDTL